eukprot:8221954-Pyramimonas_sp.AAC.1
MAHSSTRSAPKAIINAPTHEEVLDMVQTFRTGQDIAQANKEILEGPRAERSPPTLGRGEPDGPAPAAPTLGDMGPPTAPPRRGSTPIAVRAPEAKTGYAASVATGTPAASAAGSSSE